LVLEALKPGDNGEDSSGAALNDAVAATPCFSYQIRRASV